MAKWIQTPDGLTVNESAIAEIIDPRQLSAEEYVIEIVMLNADPSRKDRRILCRGTKAECDTFLADLKAELEIIPKPKKKPTTKGTATNKAKGTATSKAKTAKAEPETDDAPSEA